MEVGVQLPYKIRENLVDELDDYLESYGSDPDPEAVATYMIELLESYADDQGIEDIIVELEESGALDEPLQDVLETEMNSNDEFEYTGEEIVSLLERTCVIEWEEAEEEDEEEEEGEEEEEEESDLF